MLDINLIRTKPDWVKTQLLKRVDKVDFTELLNTDEERRKLLQEVETLRAERNRVTGDIAKIKKEKGNADNLIKEMQDIGVKIETREVLLVDSEKRMFDIMATFPNIPADGVLAGGKENNKVVQSFGKKPTFTFKPKDHVELCTKLGLIDYERAAKISGAGAWIYTGTGAILEWALLNYFIDFHIANGYKFMLVPHLLNYESGYAAGQFPKFADDVFITNFDADIKKSKFLLPTSETALINVHRNEVLPANELPIKYAGFSPCYRKEAGSYRTSERGMIRGYQFNKVEMFIFCKAEDSDGFHNELVRNAEKLVEGLGLHYQTSLLAAGDMSSAMAKTYDVEVWLPSLNDYKEVSSISNGMCYQPRRAMIRTKGANGNEFVHALNASGLATSRLVPAIVEQFQNADGSVNVPEVLHKYMHGIKVIK